MNPQKLLDPLAMWREAVDKLEGGINTTATRNMETEQFAQALSLVLRASLGTHHLVDKQLAKVYARVGLPSRSEVQELAASLRRIEDKLDMLLPPPAPVHRPARTKRAPEALVAEAPKASPAAVGTKATPATVARKATSKRKG